MPRWVRLDSTFPDHPKILAVGPIGAWVYLQGLCYAGAQATNGFIPDGVIAKLLVGLERVCLVDDAKVRGKLRRTHPALDTDWPARLVAVGLWERVEGGYWIHNYLKRQKPADYFDKLSDVRADAGRRGATARWGITAMATNGKRDGKLPSEAMANDGKPEWQTDGTIRDDTDKPCFVSSRPNGIEPPTEPPPFAAVVARLSAKMTLPAP